ncbi:flagellar biosynthesis protein FlhB [Acidihalobacter ferrooxydans]|uniref:Flagellar biosynthetic protein FlhB n=1 Tax=Acidihalobacter ferrooxydans TaxID=1765967 RepID=A0A1P8UGR2_9GAMM|nr:flagellar biosynthesis protein FlhB [Acidihalobacter ferrooxydans]APZ43022.1 flagellar biosynthesis protein FlhB [Acidihalobacter ferrooxydans]
MAAGDDFQERTEQATPKRLREAREKGQVPRSRELSTMAVVLAAAGGLLIFGPHLAQGLLAQMRDGLSLNRGMVTHSDLLIPALFEAIRNALWLVTPLLALLVVASLLASVALGGLNFSIQSLAFKPERLDPLKGLGRVFSANGLMELVKALVKFLLVGGLAVLLLWYDAPRLLALGSLPLNPALMQAGFLLGWGFVLLASTLILIAAVDTPFQLWQHAKQLRMTRQEVRDEFKETEGKPELKSRQRALQREIAQRRMMEEVPRADVVVTNPTHYAVALRYEEQGATAPTVVAKGRGEIAARIRERAEAHSVPVYSAPPLARSLYAHARLGEEIPTALYIAVAQLLAYVYQLKAGQAEAGARLDLPIPAELEVPATGEPD